jgi:hypothetical protein
VKTLIEVRCEDHLEDLGVDGRGNTVVGLKEIKLGQVVGFVDVVVGLPVKQNVKLTSSFSKTTFLHVSR